MKAKKASINTEFGPLILGIRSYVRRWGSYEFDGCKILSFNEEEDLEISEQVLKERSQMAFQVICANKIEGRLYAYLGSLYHKWDDDLGIELKYQGRRESGFHQWWAEGGSKKDEDEGEGVVEDEDVARIRKEYWCASEADVYVFLRNSEGLRPIKDKKGKEIGTRVRLGYSGDYEKIYDGVVDDYTEEGLKGNIGSQFEKFAEFKKARERAEKSIGVELYKRMNDVLPKYKEFLGQIVRSPSMDLSRTREPYDLNASQAIQHFESQPASVTLRHVREARPAGDRQIPVRFTQGESTRTPDTKANRYVVASVVRVHNLIKRVKRHLESEQEASGWTLKRHDDAYDNLEREQDRFSRYRHTLSDRFGTFDSSRTSFSYQNISEFSYDQRYLKLKQLTERLDKVLDYVDSSNIPFEIEAFNEVYEKWSFYKVLESLKECGYKITDKEEVNKTEFYRNPVKGEVFCRMKINKFPNKIVEVWYNKEYKKASNSGGHGGSRPYGLEDRFHRTRYDGNKRKPDIAIEQHDCNDRGKRLKGSAPSIVTIDPTLAPPKKNSDKYKYRDAIRHFQEVNSNDLSKRIVKCAWGIWPGRVGKNQWVTSPGPEKDKKHGFAHLRAEEESMKQFPKTIEEILEEAEML